MTYVVAAFYKFAKLPDFNQKRSPLFAYCQDRNVKGTILLAEEGINGTIAGSREAIDAVLALLRSDPPLSDLEHRESCTTAPPFEKLKVRVKKEIITIGVPGIDPNQKVGVRVSPEEWNQIISDPEVTLIDTRNDYEVSIGTFQGAKDPQTQSFRDFPDYIHQNLDPQTHKKVALFCTGGIRCEKASSLLIEQGFQEVYQLQGGILKYLEIVPPEQSLWQGECFVFDQRVAVKHGLEEGSYNSCRACGHPISDQDKALPTYREGIFCPHCFESLTEERLERQMERQRQVEMLRRNQAKTTASSEAANR